VWSEVNRQGEVTSNGYFNRSCLLLKYVFPNLETAELCISFVCKHATGLTTSRRILAENVQCQFEWVRWGTGFVFLIMVTLNIASLPMILFQHPASPSPYEAPNTDVATAQ
jgi:hypothetical protein